MNESGKSDKPVVPKKPANMSFWQFMELVERVEGRGLAKENGEDAIDVLSPVGPAKQVDRTQSRVGEGSAIPEDLHNAPDRVRQAKNSLGRHHPRQEPGAVIPHAGICAGGGGQPPSLPRQLEKMRGSAHVGRKAWIANPPTDRKFDSAGPPVAMAAMCHSRIELTNLYTDPALLDVAGAVNALPAFGTTAVMASAATKLA